MIEAFAQVHRKHPEARLLHVGHFMPPELEQEVLRDAQRRLDKGVDSREVVEFATAMLMKKMLHNPSVRLREAAQHEDVEILDATRSLFGIDED